MFTVPGGSSCDACGLTTPALLESGCCRAQVWAVGEVLNVLQALVDKSGIVAELAADGGARWVVVVQGWGGWGAHTNMRFCVCVRVGMG